jgi:DnaJ-class molecular chaperone
MSTSRCKECNGKGEKILYFDRDLKAYREVRPEAYQTQTVRMNCPRCKGAGYVIDPAD